MRLSRARPRSGGRAAPSDRGSERLPAHDNRRSRTSAEHLLDPRTRGHSLIRGQPAYRRASLTSSRTHCSRHISPPRPVGILNLTRTPCVLFSFLAGRSTASRTPGCTPWLLRPGRGLVARSRVLLLGIGLQRDHGDHDGGQLHGLTWNGHHWATCSTRRTWSSSGSSSAGFEGAGLLAATFDPEVDLPRAALRVHLRHRVQAELDSLGA